MNSRLVLLVPIFIITGFFISYEEMPDPIVISKIDFKSNAVYEYPFSFQADTLYLLNDEYISISLKSQEATVYFRNDSSISFKISSGNANIPKGLNTPTGLYTVQSKSPKAVSKQFNDAELFSWVGFNGNIGFHGLAGSGYYHYLGKRPSSHGCIRISRQDGEALYKKVRVGTPVLVYQQQPAIVLKFTDSNDIIKSGDYFFRKKDKAAALYFKERMNNLYKGLLFRNGYHKVFFDGKSVIRNRGLAIGEADSVPFYQKPSFNAFSNFVLASDVKYKQQFKDTSSFQYSFRLK